MPAVEEKPVAMQAEDLTIAHTWTNGGDEVLILKCVAPDGKAFGGFQWPLEAGATVTAEDWTPKNECGGGLHGWPWGLGIGDGKGPDWSGRWIVFGAQPEDVVGTINGEQKCKARTGIIRFVGDWQSATNFVLAGQIALIQKVSNGNGSATGDSSASSATGDRSASSATGCSSASSATGYRSASSATGYSSASSATGYSSASSATGDRSASSATGYSSASSATGDSSASSATGDSSASSATGDSSAAVVTGHGGKAQAGRYGCIALAWWNSAEDRFEMRCREIGCGDGSDGKLKASVWYRLDESGRFVVEAEVRPEVAA